jgi:hypothetical protein
MCSFTLIPSLKKTLFPIARLPTVCEVIFSFRGADDVTSSKSDAYVFSAKDWASLLATMADSQQCDHPFWCDRAAQVY